MTACQTWLSRPHNSMMKGNARTSTYFSKHNLGFSPSLPTREHPIDRHRKSLQDTYEGKIVPFAPPSGISLFLSDCVDASA